MFSLFRRWCAGLSGALIVVSLAMAAYAQVGAPSAIPDSFRQPGAPSPLSPNYLPPETPRFKVPDTVLPPGDDRRATSNPDLLFRLEAVNIQGSTVFTQADYEPIVQKYLGREISSADLQDLRFELTRLYVDKGYITSGVVLPDQDVVGGTVTFAAIEGRVTEIEISGNAHLATKFIQWRLERGLTPPLNVKTLESQIQILLQSPFIERINAELRPGVNLGKGTLVVLISEKSRLAGSVVAANDRSPSVDGEHAVAQATVRDLTGWGDSISVLYGETQGLIERGASFSIPISSSDTTFGASINTSESKVIEEPLRILDVRSQNKEYEFNLTHPFYRTPSKEFSGTVSLARKRSETFLLGRSFSFTNGRESNVTDITVIQLTQNWSDRGRDQALALRSSFSFGLSMFGADAAGTEANGKFEAWLGQAQWARRYDVWLNPEVIAKIDLQIANGPLPSIERFSMGGLNSVRGYRVNQLVLDQGIVASVEPRLRLFSLRVPWVSKFAEDGVVRLAPFVDFGYGNNKKNRDAVDAGQPPQRVLISAGVGLIWDINSSVKVEAYWGRALDDISAIDHDMQDEGLHFRITAAAF